MENKMGTEHALLHYPVYAKIFQFLEVPDLLSCMNTCSSWKSFLKPKRCRFLFKMVLPAIVKDLFKPDILNCRAVCRDWNESVTRVYENPPERLSTWDGVPHSVIDETTGKKIVTHDQGISFLGPENLTNFLTLTDSHPRNPIFGRTINLRATNDYWTNWRKLLLKFGTEIWHAFIVFNDDEIQNEARETDTIEARLRDCFLLMPNLKSLDLAIWGYDNEHEFEFARRLPSFVEETPFPLLRHLESFSFCQDDTLWVLIHFVITDCCTQRLKRLKIPALHYSPLFWFPNLEDLELKIQSGDFFFLKEEFPHLKKLNLRLPSISYQAANLRFQRAFKYLEQFKETLTEVTISSSLDYRFISDDYRVNLPKLVKLDIQYGPFPGHPYELLPSLSSLPSKVLENRRRHIEQSRVRREEQRLIAQQIIRDLDFHERAEQLELDEEDLDVDDD